MQKAIDFLTSRDKILKSIVDDFGLPIVQIREEGFASMCHIILEQQVSIASAKACYEKLRLKLGEVSAENVIAASDEDLRACGISRQKTIYLKDLAAKVFSNELDFTSFATKGESVIRAELLAIKGVGNWSIEVYLMFCLQSPDVIPLGDIAIRNTMKELYRCSSLEEMTLLSGNWKPFRTIASYILWHYYLTKRKRINLRVKS
jgi:DNA-3-methyladenine glycosylase II